MPPSTTSQPRSGLQVLVHPRHVVHPVLDLTLAPAHGGVQGGHVELAEEVLEMGRALDLHRPQCKVNDSDPGSMPLQTRQFSAKYRSQRSQRFPSQVSPINT